MIIKVTKKKIETLFDIYKLSHHFDPSVRIETKHIKSLCFHSWKETPTKDTRSKCNYSIVYNEHHENAFTMTSEN